MIWLKELILNFKILPHINISNSKGSFNPKPFFVKVRL